MEFVIFLHHIKILFCLASRYFLCYKKLTNQSIYTMLFMCFSLQIATFVIHYILHHTKVMIFFLAHLANHSWISMCCVILPMLGLGAWCDMVFTLFSLVYIYISLCIKTDYSWTCSFYLFGYHDLHFLWNGNSFISRLFIR